MGAAGAAQRMGIVATTGLKPMSRAGTDAAPSTGSGQALKGRSSTVALRAGLREAGSSTAA
jgi:hypothetical protein